MKRTVNDVIVIGGGLHGLSAGLHLAREGQRVLILEQSWVGRHASGASAAGVSTLNRAIEELPIASESMEMWHNIESIVGAILTDLVIRGNTNRKIDGFSVSRILRWSAVGYYFLMRMSYSMSAHKNSLIKYETFSTVSQI